MTMGRRCVGLAPEEILSSGVLTIADYQEKEVNDLSLAKKVFVDLHEKIISVYDEKEKVCFRVAGAALPCIFWKKTIKR